MAILLVFCCGQIKGQEVCGFIDEDAVFVVGCDTACEWFSPSIQHVRQTGGYVLTEVPFDPPLAPGTGTVQNTVVNNFTGNISLPFGFSFYNTDFFALKVSRKGFLTFNTGLSGTYNYPNQALGSATLPSNSIMAPYAYISNSGGGEIRTATLGEFPCRRFVISWENLPHAGCASNELVSQVILFESSNKVEMHIGQFESCLGITAVVGIQGGAGEGSLGPAEFSTGELDIVDRAFNYSPNGEQLSSVYYFVNGEPFGAGDSIEVCFDEETMLTVAMDVPQILPTPPVAGTCDAIPDEACDTNIVYNFNLNAAQTDSINFSFDAELLGFRVTNNWTPNGGSWPGDMGLQICDPSGTCGYIQGFNINLSGTNLGDWPFNWNTTAGGFYESCFTVSPGLLEGDGNWTITIQNGWTGSGGGVNFDGMVTLIFGCDTIEVEPPVVFLDSLAYSDSILVIPVIASTIDCIDDINGNGICDEDEMELCGAGTIWSEVAQECVFNECVADLNGDGLVSVVDLLMFLPTMSLECPSMEASLEECGCDQGPMASEQCTALCAQMGEGLSPCEEPLAAVCGTGTIWSLEFQGCIPYQPCVHDLNFDGSTTVSDLLILLANFQMACPD